LFRYYAPLHTETMMKKILDTRRKTHGNYTETAAAIQETKDLWRAHPGWENLSPVQRETLEMVAHKVGRILCGNPNFIDHWVDIAGYAQITSDRVDE